MSTNATISVRTKDDSLKIINNHWDGYPSYLGCMLRDYYGTQELAEALVNLGDVSIVCKSIVCKSIECPEGHTFETPVDGYSIFYTRDRGDKHCKTRIVSNVTIGDARKYTAFNYHWNGNGWYINNVLLTKVRISY